MQLRKILRRSIFAVLTISTLLSAQEGGEMLWFDGQPNLDLRLSAAEVAADSIIYQSPVSAASHAPFNRVLLNGLAAHPGISLQMRVQTGANQWRDWRDMYVKMFPNGRFWARLDLPDEFAHRVQYRVLNQGAPEALRLEIYAVEGVDEKSLAAEAQPPAPPSAADIFFGSQDTIPRPPVVTRAEWGANPPIGTYVPHNPYRLTQHHTAGRRVATLSEGIAEMQFIQDFHQNGRGWQDIGYHFCVDDAGRIYEGVPPDFRGTHVGGNNTGNVGISYMGNFQIAGEFPTPQTLQSLVQIWSWLAFSYGVNPDSLFGHRDYNATDCPGANLYGELPELRNGIREMLTFGAPYVANPFPQPFSQEVAPGTGIQFRLRDSSEGVDINSIEVRVNNAVVSPQISGTPADYLLSYLPPVPFPHSQNVVVDVTAADLAAPPNAMSFSYRFTIEVAALHTEVVNGSTVQNGILDLAGDWLVDPSDVSLPDLSNGSRLLATDSDGSHVAKIYPAVPESGDYRVFIASNSSYTGESAHYRLINEAGAVHPLFSEYNRVNFRQWGLLSPTPVHFESGGTGFIEVSGISGLPTRLMVDAFRLERVDRLDAPTAPTLKWVKRIAPSSRQVEVAWYPSLEGDIAGYRLFMSADGRTWGDPLADESTLGPDVHQFTLDANTPGNTVYFRVVAVDTNRFINENGDEIPLTSGPTDIYGAGFGSGPNILIVDNFDRQASWQLPHHPFARSHGHALDANGFGFETCTETAVQTGEIDLRDYEVVIYFCGDDSESDESLAAADQSRLENYLENGGKLFISGSEIGYDLASRSTAAERTRYENLLRARYVGDLSGSNRVLGQSGTVFEGLEFIYGTLTGEDQYIEDFPDYIQPLNGSQTALFYDNLRIAGVQFTGKYGNGVQDARLVYLGFTFETITTPEDRTALLARVMQYFDITTGIADGDMAAPLQFELLQNYPNPFNPSTLIGYTVPPGHRDAPLRLEIFNTLGQKVRTLVSGTQPPGHHAVTWDARNDAGRPVASGIYYYRLSAPGFVQTRKLVLLR